MIEAEEVDLPPLHEWAMDPSISSFQKVFIAQIHSILVVPYSGHQLFYLRRKPILKAHVVGIVVSIDIRPKKITYHVDDGTGVIRCVRYLNEYQIDFSLSLRIGDLVMVKGMLEMYETNTEPYGFALKVSIIGKISDPNLETFHIASTLNMFQVET
jgi:hypothetical protein